MATTTAKTVKKAVAKTPAKPTTKTVKAAVKATAKPKAKTVKTAAKTTAKKVARPAQSSAKTAGKIAAMTAAIPATLAEKPEYWDEALAQLEKRDRILKKIIPQFPDIWLTTRGNPFITLARSICGQQISVKAAESVWQRVLLECGKRPSPASVQKAGLERLRAAGLSGRKAEYILDLSTHFSDKLVQPAKWVRMPDEEIIEELTAIRGIGRWTAEMFLIFNLQRPDVLPLDDVGLLNAISLHYFSGEPVSRFEAREVAQGWQPFRTVATWYLWRSLDPVPVEY
jgi:DNA-3-methyladenine glycosylase II